MSGIWGNNIKYSIFGESHGAGIGITIDGLPSGIKLDMEKIKFEMDRRRPGRNSTSTPRNESDSFEILSGFFNGRTTGVPLCALIRNNNNNSKDYNELQYKMRPGHGDYTGNIRYNGFNDYRGGGHFSGRITAPMVFAGAVGKQILRTKGIIITSHIKRIGKVEDEFFNSLKIDSNLAESLKSMDIPTISAAKADEMKEYILQCKNERDSVGGIIEAAVLNLPAGVGSPFFDSVESELSHLLFSIPAVKGVEFGAGFDFGSMKGSEVKDEYYYEDGNVRTYTNNNGGITGGITNGMPLIFRIAVKPTPSIGLPQRTIDIKDKVNTTLEVKGRHDPCIVPRAVPVVEAAAAMAVLDLIRE